MTWSNLLSQFPETRSRGAATGLPASAAAKLQGQQIGPVTLAHGQVLQTVGIYLLNPALHDWLAALKLELRQPV